MDIDHKFDTAKVCATLCSAGGAKIIEHFTHPLNFFAGFTMADWATFFALVYSFQQAVLSTPAFIRKVKGWVRGIFN